MNNVFRRLAGAAAEAAGNAWSFCLAFGCVLAWALTGPAFHFSETWQLVINTSTTIVTFLMVFLIQNAQNRDSRAVHLKLDELIRGVEGARNRLVDLEECTDEEIAELTAEFRAVREREHSNKQVSATRTVDEAAPES